MRNVGSLMLVLLLSCKASAPHAVAGSDAGSKRSTDAATDAAPVKAPVETATSNSPPPEVRYHSEDWPLPNLDYDNTRASFTTLIDSTTVSELQEAWTLPFDRGGPFGYVTANPIIVGDTIYIQDMASNVFAVARNTGKVRWQHRIDIATVGPNGVGIGWGKIFVNHGDTAVVALDADSGQELWRFAPKLVSSEGIDIQPIAFGGSVFVSTVPASLRGSYLGGSRGVIHALDADNGAVRWSFDTVASDDFWGDPVNNGGGGAWYPPLIDFERGLCYWGIGNPSPWPGLTDHPSGSSRPGPNLYTSSLVALDLQSGDLRWYHQERAHDLFDWDFQNAPMRIRAGGKSTSPSSDLVIGSGKTGTVVALDAATGKLVWRTKVGRHENDELDVLPSEPGINVYPGALGGVLTATAYADGVVYAPVVDLPSQYSGTTFSADFADGRGALTALDVRDGHPLWSSPLPAPCYGAATVVNDLVFTSDANGRVYAFARDGGRELWHYDAPGGINAPLAVAGDLLLIPVGLDEPALIALRLPH
jgi:glucose dehydrogenase